MLSPEGAVPAKILHVRRGLVVLSTERNDHSCAVRGPGTLLGLEALLGRSSPHSVRALTDVAVCTLDPGSFSAWTGPLDTPLGVAFRLSVEETARRTSERKVVQGSALRRVARFLHEALSGGERPDVSQRVLAKVLGMRAETLSRVLAELRSSGILAPGRTICVEDPGALAKLAE